MQNVRPGHDWVQYNGGVTKTIALMQGSPTVDAVREGCAPPAADQRGVSRP
ncbi:MAG TPA: choice-of-anchor Q domain-containing protein [Rubrobacteraceae bacterium]